jgi:hypothetical protein
MKKTFHDIFSDQLRLILGKYRDDRLNDSTCSLIYQDIYQQLLEVLKGSSLNVHQDTVNWLSQQYYDGIKINGNSSLNPNIFTKRPNLTDLPTKDLVVLLAMTQKTGFARDVAEELKKRGLDTSWVL